MGVPDMVNRSVRPWRIHRFVEAGHLPSGVVASHYEERNLTLIDKEIYDQLTPGQQHRVFASRAVRLEVA